MLQDSLFLLLILSIFVLPTIFLSTFTSFASNIFLSGNNKNRINKHVTRMDTERLVKISRDSISS